MSKFNNKSNQQSGQAVIIVSVFLILSTMAIIGGFIGPVTAESRAAQALHDSRRSYFLAEAGVEDVYYRLRTRKTVADTEVLTLDGVTATTTVGAELSGDREVVSVGQSRQAVRVVRNFLTISSGASFSFGIQTDVGGFILENSAEIIGNVYANGPITTSSNSRIRGDVVSAGPAGSVNGANVTGSVYANRIENATIGKDAHYQTLINSTVTGQTFPQSADLPTSTLPITDAMIEVWQQDAEEGGVYTGPCPYNISSNTTIGPIKIPCDLNISGNDKVTVNIAGNVWVVGNISTNQQPNIRVASSVGNKSVALIADDPSNRSTGSVINFNNSSAFQSNGLGSYLLVLSRNNSAKNDGTVRAISLTNSSSGPVLVYAGEGEIYMANSVSLRQVTGYRLRLVNNTIVTYETGLISTLFSSGPGGGWKINRWHEVE
jgi:hypothetical protein